MTEKETTRKSNLVTFVEFETDCTVDNIKGIERIRQQVEDIIIKIRNASAFSKSTIELTKTYIVDGNINYTEKLIKAIANETGAKIYKIENELFETCSVNEIDKVIQRDSKSILYIPEVNKLLETNMDENQSMKRMLKELMEYASKKENVILFMSVTNNLLKVTSMLSGKFNVIEYPSASEEVIKEIFLGKLPKEIIDDECLVGIENYVTLLKIMEENLDEIVEEFLTKYYSNYTDSNASGNISRFSQCLCEAICIVSGGNRTGETIGISTAFHEAAHAIIASELFQESKIFVITIIARYGWRGSILRSELDRNNHEDIENNIKVSYAGAVAEEKFFGIRSNGVRGDFEAASNLLTSYIYDVGYKQESLIVGTRDAAKNEYIIKDAIKIAKKVSKKLYKETEILVEKNKDEIEKLAKLLYERKVLYPEEISKIIEN